MTQPGRQRGFAYIAAILILVALSTLAITAVKLSTTQQSTSAQDAMSGYALQAARAGTEWGLYLALVNGNCAGANQTLDHRSAHGFAVTVSCTQTDFNEGESAPGVPIKKSTFTVTATACNAASCPDSSLVGKPDYVERKRTAVACATAAPALGPC
jgi:MSHA biogenesis protein MshP